MGRTSINRLLSYPLRSLQLNATNLAESISSVVHDGACVVLRLQMVDLVEVVLQEVVLHASDDVLPVYTDMAVSEYIWKEG